MAYYARAGASESTARRWVQGLLQRLDSLSTMPRRYPVVEDVTGELGREIRRMNYGDHAILYQIDDVDRIVTVVAFRHGARDSVGGELGDDQPG